jgi:hypothetical protein
VGRIEWFEELIAWQKARALTRAIYEVTRQGAFAKDYGLSGQILAGRCFDHVEYRGGV